jgi:CheY-like chemotaxis protein
MTKQVLDVGNCSMDHGNIKYFIETSFDASVVRAHDQEGALDFLRSGAFDLVLVNRVFHRDRGDGLELISRIKNNPQWCATPAMLISDLDDFQQQAIEAGAALGFGKKSLRSSETRRRLRPFLEDTESSGVDSERVAGASTE